MFAALLPHRSFNSGIVERSSGVFLMIAKRRHENRSLPTLAFAVADCQLLQTECRVFLETSENHIATKFVVELSAQLSSYFQRTSDHVDLLITFLPLEDTLSAYSYAMRAGFLAGALPQSYFDNDDIMNCKSQSVCLLRGPITLCSCGAVVVSRIQFMARRKTLNERRSSRSCSACFVQR